MKKLCIIPYVLFLIVLSSFAYSATELYTKVAIAWTFAETSGLLLDHEGNNDSLTADVVNKTESGINGNAWAFTDRNPDNISLPTSAFSGADEQAFYCWINPKNVTYVYILMADKPGQASTKVLIQSDFDGFWRVAIGGAEETITSVGTQHRYVTERWQTIGYTYDGSSLCAIRNDTVVGCTEASGNVQNFASVWLGVAADGSEDYSGWLDECYVFDQNLTVQNILDLWGGDYYPFSGAGGDYFEVTARSVLFNTSMAAFNLTINGTLYNTSNGTIVTDVQNNAAGLHNFNISATNHNTVYYYQHNISTDLVAYLNYSYCLLNITAEEYNGTVINSYTINATSASDNQVVSTTNGSIIISVNKNVEYTVFIDAAGYAYANKTLLTNDNIKFMNFSLYPTNSILMYVRDEGTGLLLTENSTALFSYDGGEFTENITNGTHLVESLTPAQYTITFDSESYESRVYIVTVTNRSHQTLTAFLTSSTSTTTFTVLDANSGSDVINALVTMYRTMNGSWAAIEARYTDITGRAQFSYTSSVNYKFYISRTNYTNLVFYLNPILFDSYTIELEPIISLDHAQDYDHTAIIYDPKLFYVGVDNNFTWIIQNPYGELIQYGYNLTWDGGYSTASGSNAIGEQLNTNFTLTGLGSLDQITLHYYYETTIAGIRNFTYYYPVIIATSNNTMLANKNTTYGLGLFERVFITVVMVLFIVGIATMVGQALAGMGLGLAMFGFFVYIGFLPVWLVLITITVGLLIITARPEV
jgi:hypothetical protein